MPQAQRHCDLPRSYRCLLVDIGLEPGSSEGSWGAVFAGVCVCTYMFLSEFVESGLRNSFNLSRTLRLFSGMLKKRKGLRQWSEFSLVSAGSPLEPSSPPNATRGQGHGASPLGWASRPFMGHRDWLSVQDCPPGANVPSFSLIVRPSLGIGISWQWSHFLEKEFGSYRRALRICPLVEELQH